MTPCETDKHWNWSFATRDTEAKFTTHNLPVTGECVQFLLKLTLGQLSEQLIAVETYFCWVSNYMK